MNRRGSQQRKEDLKEPNRGKPTDQIVPLQFSRVIKVVLILELNMKLKENNSNVLEEYFYSYNLFGGGGNSFIEK